MESKGLASEILHTMKTIIIILAILLFASNIAWIIAWNLPDKQVTESYELQGEDDANVVYNSQGEVQIDGQNQSEEDNGIENK